MVEFMKRLLISVLTVLVFSGATAYAAQTNLPEGFIIGDSDGIHVETDGTYLIYADNITPGETIIKTVTIRNLERGKTPFRLSMTAEPELVSGPVSLLDVMTLTLTMNDKVLYHGRLRGDEGVDMIRNSLQLGKYAQGDSKVLHIKIETGDWEQYPEKSVAEIRWNFYAVKEDLGELPQTGDYTHFGLYLLGMLLSMAGFILLLFGERRKRKEYDK